MLKCWALDIGTRGGGLSLWLAWNGARVLATHIVSPIQTAFGLHQKYAVSDRIQYQALDVTEIPYRMEFDIVMFKSVLGAIGGKQSQAQAIREIHKALKPGG